MIKFCVRAMGWLPMGILLTYLGYYIDTWQFWAIFICILFADTISYLTRNEDKIVGV